MKLLLFVLLLILCWPAALALLLLYPAFWLTTLPFRLVGVAVGGLLALLSALVQLPLRLVRAL